MLSLLARDRLVQFLLPPSGFTIAGDGGAGDASEPGCEPGGNLNVKMQERAWTSPVWLTP